MTVVIRILNGLLVLIQRGDVSFPSFSELLTFWLPVFYTFKFLMNKESTRIPTILKFWCMLSCYNLISLVLKNILDE